MNRLSRLSLAFLTFIAGSLSLSAQSRTESCTCSVPSTVPMSWAIRHVDPAYQQGAMEAFATWNLYADVVRPQVVSGPATDGNAINDIYFTDLSQVPGLDSNTLGYTFQTPDSAFGDFNECPIPAGISCGSAVTEADVALNNTFNWATTRPLTDDPGVFYQATATHEIGHALGFHHNFRNLSEMNYYQHFARYVTRTDVLSLRRQFPGQMRNVSDMATYPVSYNVALQTGSFGYDAISPASVSPTNVQPGGGLTIKNWTVENLGTSAVSTVRLRFYLSKDKTITPSDTFFAYVYWDGSFTTWDDDSNGFTFKIPDNMPPGTYYVGAIVGTGDGNGFSSDAITANNSWVIPTPITVGGTTGVSSCSPSDTTLCLVGRRFSVTVSWNDGGSQQGSGHSVPFSDATGLMWFSSSDNIELLIKVLDACSFAKKIWVFGAAATTLAYDITVLDTHTGLTKVYHHANGTPATAIADTNAFATCGQ